MQWDVNKIDLWFRNALVVISGLLMALQFIYGTDNEWLNGAMILAMAGVVGYFTNLLALKMLFQPKHGSVLGWEGLVPKNKPLIAQQLGESIQTQLLSPDIIMGYINDHQMIANGTEKFEQWLDAQLQDPVIRQRINARVIAFLQERGPHLMRTIFDFSETRLKAMALNPTLLNEHWPELRTRLSGYLQDEDNRRKAAAYLRTGLLETLPQLSEQLDEAVNTYLARGNTMGRLGKQLKQMASINKTTFLELLENFVNDEATEKHFLGIADILIENLQGKLDAPETQILLAEKIEGWVEQSSRFARDTLLPRWIEALQEYLADENHWQEIDRYLLTTLTTSKDKLLEYINSIEGQTWVKSNIERLVSRLNVSGLVRDQVMKLDTDELEKMILDNTGGNLVVIQTLGGVLGLFVGTIQVNVWFAIPVFTLTGLVWILAYFNNRRHQGRP